MSRPIPVTAPPSLNKTLCPSLTFVTALLPPSNHYCRYISRPIVVTTPHPTTENVILQSPNRYCTSTSLTPLLPLHKQTNTGSCNALTTQNIMLKSHKRYCLSTPVTQLMPLHKQSNTGNCNALTTQNIMPQSHNRYCPSTPVTK